MLLLLALLVSFASAKSSGLLALYWPAYTTVQPVASIPASDIAYYFVTVTDNSTGLAVPAGQPVAEISQFVDHAHARGTKALVSVGGWTGSRFFSSLVATAASRVTFASALESFVHEHGFDGVDFDWEYPASTGIGCNGNSPSDAANFLAFLQTVRDKLGKKALITAAVASGGIIGSDGQPLSDVSGFADVLDFINVMAYDVTGSWSESTGPNAPLHNCLSGTSAESAIQYWTSAGFPASNILLGVPSYGHSFTTTSSKLILKEVSGSKTLLYQEKTSVTPMGDDLDVASMAGTDECGVSIQANQYSGVWSYRNLIAGGVLSANGKEGKGGYVRYYDECTATPFLFSPSKRDLIAYEDLESLTAKVAFANTKGLAGIFVFDFTGFPNSILKSIKNGLAGESASTSSRAKPTSSHIEHSNASHAALTLPHVEPNTTATTTSIESTTTKAPALRLTLAPTTSKQTTPPPTPTSTTDESTCTGAYVRCDSTATFSLCDCSGNCTQMGAVPDGTKCDEGVLDLLVVKERERRELEEIWERDGEEDVDCEDGGEDEDGEDGEESTSPASPTTPTPPTSPTPASSVPPVAAASPSPSGGASCDGNYVECEGSSAWKLCMCGGSCESMGPTAAGTMCLDNSIVSSSRLLMRRRKVDDSKRASLSQRHRRRFV